MEVLVPIDGSGPSDRALDFAVTFADRFDATLSVVHLSDVESDATEQILDDARERVEGAAADVELVLTDRIDVRPGDKVGREITRLVEERDVDHVVMGHHGGDGMVERVIIGSAASAVLEDLPVPTTIVP